MLFTVDLVHGDLTTSNLLAQFADARALLPSPTAATSGDSGQNAGLVPGQYSLVLLDLGLSSISALAEDKAVDLYVLERALLAAHPRCAPLLDALLGAYQREYGAGAGERAQLRDVLRKLDDVRLRGRKRSMLG